MEKFRTIIIIAVLITVLGIMLAACHFDRHTTVVENSNGHEIRIESYGKVYFNKDQTAIDYISPGGHLEYHNDGRELKAENDHHGGIRYELAEDGQTLDPSSHKAFITEAVRTMIAKGYHSN